MSPELRRSCTQLRDERVQLGDLVLRTRQLVADDGPQSVLDRAAGSALPCRGEVDDLVERAPELLRPGDERQSIERMIVVEAIPGRRASRRGKDPDLFVVAQRRRAETAAVDDVLDLVRGVHHVIINPQVNLKVKRFLAAPSMNLCNRLPRTRVRDRVLVVDLPRSFSTASVVPGHCRLVVASCVGVRGGWCA